MIVSLTVSGGPALHNRACSRALTWFSNRLHRKDVSVKTPGNRRFVGDVLQDFVLVALKFVNLVANHHDDVVSLMLYRFQRPRPGSISLVHRLVANAVRAGNQSGERGIAHWAGEGRNSGQERNAKRLARATVVRSVLMRTMGVSSMAERLKRATTEGIN